MGFWFTGATTRGTFMGIDCGETRAAPHTIEHECEDEVIEVGVRMFAGGGNGAGGNCAQHAITIRESKRQQTAMARCRNHFIDSAIDGAVKE